MYVRTGRGKKGSKSCKSTLEYLRTVLKAKSKGVIPITC